MKKILTLFALLCLALPALNAQQISRKVQVYFQHSHTQTDLDNIKAELGAQKILLDYTYVKFDDEGHLVELKFTVDCQDGFKGFGETQDVPEDMSFGFIRDYQPDAKVPFAVGNLNKQ